MEMMIRRDMPEVPLQYYKGKNVDDLTSKEWEEMFDEIMDNVVNILCHYSQQDMEDNIEMYDSYAWFKCPRTEMSKHEKVQYFRSGDFIWKLWDEGFFRDTFGQRKLVY